MSNPWTDDNFKDFDYKDLLDDDKKIQAALLVAFKSLDQFHADWKFKILSDDAFGSVECAVGVGEKILDLMREVQREMDANKKAMAFHQEQVNAKQQVS